MKVSFEQTKLFSLMPAPTFNFGSSLAARANNSVVFPELGGPKSNVILNRRKWKHYIGPEGVSKLRYTGLVYEQIYRTPFSLLPARLYYSTNILENTYMLLATS